jgi:hypothetical protein
LHYEEGIGHDGEANKLVEIEYVFKHGDSIYSSSLLKGSFRFIVSSFDSDLHEADVLNKMYLEHMKQLAEKYDKVLLLNLLNMEHGIENSEIIQLEDTIQRCPLKSSK